MYCKEYCCTAFSVEICSMFSFSSSLFGTVGKVLTVVCIIFCRMFFSDGGDDVLGFFNAVLQHGSQSCMQLTMSSILSILLTVSEAK